jgi:hypothetical protein
MEGAIAQKSDDPQAGEYRDAYKNLAFHGVPPRRLFLTPEHNRRYTDRLGISMAYEPGAPHSIKIIDTEICSAKLKAEHPELWMIEEHWKGNQ